MCKKNSALRYKASDCLFHPWLCVSKRKMTSDFDASSALSKIIKVAFFMSSVKVNRIPLLKLTKTTENGQNTVIKSAADSPRKFTRFCFKPDWALSQQKDAQRSAKIQKNLIRLRQMIASKMKPRNNSKDSEKAVSRNTTMRTEMPDLKIYAKSIIESNTESKPLNLINEPMTTRSRNHINHPSFGNLGQSPSIIHTFDAPVVIHSFRNSQSPAHKGVKKIIISKIAKKDSVKNLSPASIQNLNAARNSSKKKFGSLCGNYVLRTQNRIKLVKMNDSNVDNENIYGLAKPISRKMTEQFQLSQPKPKRPVLRKIDDFSPRFKKPAVTSIQFYQMGAMSARKHK